MSEFDDGTIDCTVISLIKWTPTDAPESLNIPSDSKCEYDKCPTRDTPLEQGSALEADAIFGNKIARSTIYVHSECHSAAATEEQLLRNKFLEELSRLGESVFGGPADGGAFLVEVPPGMSVKDFVRDLTSANPTCDCPSHAPPEVPDEVDATMLNSHNGSEHEESEHEEGAEENN